MFIADINGDGKADLIVQNGTQANACGAGQIDIYYSTGTGYGAVFCPGIDANRDFLKLIIADLNGDHRSDLVIQAGTNYAGCNAGQISYFLSRGNQFSPVNCNGFDANSDFGSISVADVNGDGRDDFIYQGSTSGGHFGAGILGWFRTKVSSTDVAYKFVDGIGVQNIADYKPLTDNSVYTKDTVAAYPVKDIQESLYVVSAVSTSNGLGGLNTANYSYTGMKEHQTGRGNLGFHTMTMIGADGIKSVTTNNQTFPYVGMADRVDVYQTNGTTLLSSSVNTFKCLSGTGTSLNSNPALCAPPAYSATAIYGSTLYLPFVSSSTSLSWDLNGSALPTSTSTVNTLDAYGNTLGATAATSDGYSKTSTTYYNNDIANWRLGWVVASQVSSTVPLAYSNTGAAQSQTRTTLNSYDSLGRLIRTVSEPEAGSYTISTSNNSSTVTYTEPAAPPKPYYTLISEYGYDATYGYGNSVKVRGKDLYKLDVNGDIVKDASNNPVLAARETKKQIDYVNNTVTASANLLFDVIP